MALSLTNITTLPKTLLKKAEGCTVRECDETATGAYEAYVDEGAETFDVALTILPNKEIGTHRCDCKSGDAFCRHKAALLLALAKGKKKPSGKTAKSKQSKAGALLDATDAEHLKSWLKTLFEKNKDLELAFVQRFSAARNAYTPDEVARLTAEAVKSVVRNRTKVEQSELKKIIELWKGAHAPVVAYYVANVTDENAFAAFHALLESCLTAAQRLTGTTTKISRYVEDVLRNTAEAVRQLYEDAAWQTATGYFINTLPDGRSSIRLHYLDHLKNIAGVGSAGRPQQLIGRLMEQYGRSSPEQLANGALYTKTLFALVQQHGLLEAYYQSFKPIRFDNEFNEVLIDQLIAAGHIEQAKNYCKAQIAQNYKELYNLPYLERLKRIYRLQNNEQALAEVSAELLPFRFDFEDYRFLHSRMEEGEAKKKWRTKIMTRARNAWHNGNNAAMEFYFTVLDQERAYKKMIDAIDAYTPYRIIVRYFEPMAAADGAKLLKAILAKNDDMLWGMGYEQREKDRDHFPELLALMTTQYSSAPLRSAIRQVSGSGYSYRRNHFIEYLCAALPAD